MAKVDDGEKALNKPEQERNKRTGQVMLYFAGECTEDKLLIDKHKIDGTVSRELDSSKSRFEFGEPIECSYGSLEIDIEENKVQALAFEFSKNKEHVSQLLKGAVLPEREVEDYAIYHVNRRHFQGETAIRIVEEVLRIDTSRDPIYNLRGRQERNFNGRMHENGLVGGGF